MERNILVVEDEPLTLKVVEYLLQNNGYNVIKAESLSEADRILNDSKPWLVILNKVLPDGNGIEYSKKLAITRRDVPVILLTCESRATFRQEGLKSASDYIVKPFDPDEFLQRVNAVIESNTQLEVG